MRFANPRDTRDCSSARRARPLYACSTRVCSSEFADDDLHAAAVEGAFWRSTCRAGCYATLLVKAVASGKAVPATIRRARSKASRFCPRLARQRVAGLGAGAGTDKRRGRGRTATVPSERTSSSASAWPGNLDSEDEWPDAQTIAVIQGRAAARRDR